MVKIPLLIPEMPKCEDLIPWLKKIDDNKWYTNFGPLNALLEEKLLGTFENHNYLAISSVSNCTVGLELALGALNLPRESKILIPGLTFAATGTSILRSGHIPVFGDVDSEKWILTPPIAQRMIEKFDIKAVMPVATFGQPQNTVEWDIFTQETGIPVVIDAAGAFGNQGVGLTTSAVFSLHATKSLGAGEGGFIVSHSKSFIDEIRQSTNFGIPKLQSRGYISHPGTNAKLSEYHAAVALASLEKWHSNILINKENYLQYRGLEKSIDNCRFQDSSQFRAHTLLPVRIFDQNIDQLIAKMDSSGIGCRRWYYPLLSDYSCFEGCQSEPLINSKKISEELIGLPFYPSINKNSIDKVMDAVINLIKTT
jgi:dTDP-4-amino-4,6-dideoxygalactose transaminase